MMNHKEFIAVPWAVCYSTGFEPEAYLVKGFLENRGIPCVIENSRHPVGFRTFGGISLIDVLVPDDWIPVASKLINRQSKLGRKGRGRRVIEVDFRRRCRLWVGKGKG